MKKLVCWLNGHRYHTLTRICSRCGEPHPWLEMIDLLTPLVASLTRIAEEHYRALTTPPPKPELEILRPLSELDEVAMHIGREHPHLRNKLPEKYRKMLEEEDQSWASSGDTL